MKTKVIGLNKFLSTIYATDMKLSTLLSGIGYDVHQIQFLRRNYLEELINGCTLLLNQRIMEVIPIASPPLKLDSELLLEVIPEIENIMTTPDPVESIERLTHTFDFEVTQEGYAYLMIREFRENDVAEIVILEDEIEQFYLDFHKSIKLGGWKKHLKSYRLSDIRKQHPRAYEEWTDDEEMRLKEMFEEGEKIIDIARYLERQPGAIRSRLSKLNLQNKDTG